ncbi:NACHT domain-containing protein [Streptomyces sp. NPDC059900]|uniref:NACHT domain-containing protein n=1 Tax=Streptomyces sp. NPDC059900 TaxID=3155816 RepID=UPI0034437C41
MDPAVIGTRLASGAVAPLIKKLFVREGPGAGLVDKPVRLAGLISFRGEKRTLTERDVRRLAGELVAGSLSSPGEPPFPPDEADAVTDALARALLTLGDLDMDDVQAVRLGHRKLARSLIYSASSAGLSADAAFFLDSITEWACLHILQFFTQRSTFVAATLVDQSRNQDELIAKVDELLARTPRQGAQDAAFERRYLAYVAKKHGKLTIYGIDLANSSGRWPLDAAYMSLEATERADRYPSADREIADVLARTSPRIAQWADQGTEPAPTPRPADRALADHDRVLLRGEAGSGKTTLVQWLAVSAARSAPDEDRMTYLYDHIPYVLPLRTLTRHGERLPAPKDFLSAVDCPLAGTQPGGWESRVLTAGRALVLVDGIDEIPDAERSRTRVWLRDLIDAYPGNRWLVTSRPSAVREDWLSEEDFTELTLSPMSREDAAAFISRWHVAARTGAADEDAALVAYESQLLDAVHAKPDLGLLATNPLMCGLICALHRDRRGFLPLGRKDLYTAALSMLLIRRDRERHMDIPELREEPQLQLLQRLAYWLIRNGRTTMDRSRADAIITDALPSVPEVAALGDAKAVFEHFLHRSGLLREPAPGTVDFIHRTFQDFLGARAAVDEGDFGVLARHGADDQWEDVIRMAVAHARPRERAEILGDLLTFGDRHAEERARVRVHLLAAACLEHAAELAPEVREQVELRVAEVIPPRSAEAARELAAVGPMVLDLLPGPDGLNEQEASNVAITATSIPSDAAIPFLARFARHPALAVHSQLMWGWSRYDCRRYAEAVITQLDDGETYFTLRSADQVMELERLGIRPKLLDIRETVSPTAASRLIAACTPTFLNLKVPPGRLSAEARHGLRNLDQLRLTDISEPWSLDLIPAEAPLRTLGVWDSARAVHDLHVLDKWQKLEWVIFGETDHPGSAATWVALTRLTHLIRLDLTSSGLTHAPAGMTLPGVTELSLMYEGFDWASAVSHVTRLFPGLTRLSVYGLSARAQVSVAPLARLSALRHLTISAHQVSDLDALPSRIEVRAPHPVITQPSIRVT